MDYSDGYYTCWRRLLGLEGKGKDEKQNLHTALFARRRWSSSVHA